MPAQPGVWGIDIGQCALKAVRLELVDGVVTATAFDYVEHPKILSQPDADPDQLTREALEKFLSRNSIKGDHVAIGIAGQSGLARFVKLPPVEEKKIPDIVRFEAKQQIPFPLEEVVWDYQKIGEGVVTDGFAMETEVGLFAMKRDMISRFLGHFQSVNVEVHTIQMAPLALCNYVSYDLLKKGGPEGQPAPEAPPAEEDEEARGKKRCVVALDIGTDSSSLIITDGGKIIWQRPIPLGGNHFTRALTKELKLTFAKAEHLKRNAAKSPDLAKILKALKPVLTDFVGEVQRSLGYFTNTHRDAYVAYMVGLGSAFRLPGLQKYLGEKLGLEVRKPARFERVAGESVTAAPVFTENILTFPVAYGLALQGLGLARLTTNLLPPEIGLARRIRAKKPWVAAAAACLLLGTTFLAYGYSVPYAAVNDPTIETAINNTKSSIDQAKTVVGQVDAKEKQVEATKLEVQTLIAGQEERLNWIRLNEFINACLPVPGDRGNLLGPGQRELWSTNEGVKAYDRFRARVGQGISRDAATVDEMKHELAMVDVEAVYCRHTPNLKGFSENALDYTKKYVGFTKLDTGLEKDDDPVPEGAGWVVEIRGFTYYQHGQIDARRFLLNSLVRNLREKGKGPGGPPAKADAKSDKIEDPVGGRVSNVFLYSTWEDKNPRPGTFQKIHASLIDNLVPAAAATGSQPTTGPGPGPMGPMNPMGPMGQSYPGMSGERTAAPGWSPLTSTSAGVGPGSGAERGPGKLLGMPMPGGPNLPGFGTGGAGGNNPYATGAGGTNMPGYPGGPNTPGQPYPGTIPGVIPGKAPEPKGDKNVRSRYEFVVVFVWREPTPSDKLIKSAPAPQGAPPAGMPAAPVKPAISAPPPMPKEDGGSDIRKLNVE